MDKYGPANTRPSLPLLSAASYIPDVGPACYIHAVVAALNTVSVSPDVHKAARVGTTVVVLHAQASPFSVVRLYTPTTTSYLTSLTKANDVLPSLLVDGLAPPILIRLEIGTPDIQFSFSSAT